MRLRLATAADSAAVADVFHDAIRGLAAGDYRADQLDAWAGSPEPARWLARIGEAHREFWIAEVDGTAAGFCDLESDGHVDTLYVHPRCAGRGVASSLLQRIEERAAGRGITRLYTEASLTARPVFERHGFTVIAAQDVHYGGVVFRNYRMEKGPIGVGR
jgi:putative acetyltransferase